MVTTEVISLVVCVFLYSVKELFTKENILKSVFVHIMEVQSCLDPNVLQNIYISFENFHLCMN